MKEGYKKAELGWIPEEWNIARLEDVCDKNEKYSFTGGPFGSDLKSCHYTDDGVQIVQLQNIGEGYFINDSRIYTSEEKADELRSCNIYPNDIIIAKMAEPVARACKIPNNQSRYLMCSDGIRVVVDKNNYNNDFILYSINSNYFRNNAIANSTGSTRLRIGLSALRNLKLILPPLKEQEKIADILSTVDSQIDNTDKFIEKTKELKKGLMQRLLTKGIDHNEFKKSELGEIPVEWKVKNIDEVAKRYSGHTPDKKIENYWNGYIPWISLKDTKKLDDRYIHETEDYTTEDGINNSSAVILPKNTVVLSRDATIGKVGITSKEMATSQHFINYVCGFSLDSLYLYYDFLNKKQLFERIGIGSTIKTIGLSFFKELKIVIPPIEEQKQIANILSSVDNQIEEYENKKIKLEELKKGLMQQLLTGKIRVV